MRKKEATTNFTLVSGGDGKFHAGGNPAMDQHPIQGGEVIFLQKQK